jgi:hypothetical protein
MKTGYQLWGLSSDPSSVGSWQRAVQLRASDGKIPGLDRVEVVIAMGSSSSGAAIAVSPIERRHAHGSIRFGSRVLVYGALAVGALGMVSRSWELLLLERVLHWILTMTRDYWCDLVG